MLMTTKGLVSNLACDIVCAQQLFLAGDVKDYVSSGILKIKAALSGRNFTSAC